MTQQKVAGAIVGWALVACLIAGERAQSQEPPPQFRTDTQLVTLDVTVVDSRRRPVRGLTADDFTIVESDQRLPVTAFSEINLPPTRARSLDVVSVLPPDVATNDPVEGRLIAILFDYTIIAGEPTRTARRIAREVLEQAGPGDRVAVLFSHSIPNQSFTTDRSKLLAAIDHPALGTSLVQPMQLEDGEVYPDNETGLCPCGTCSFDAITHVARAVADVPARRKAVVFIGGYIPMNASALAPVTSPDPLFVNRDCQPSIVTAMEEMLQATQRANLTVYSFDPNGLQPAALGRIPSADLARRSSGRPGSRVTGDGRRRHCWRWPTTRAGAPS